MINIHNARSFVPAVKAGYHQPGKAFTVAKFYNSSVRPALQSAKDYFKARQDEQRAIVADRNKGKTNPFDAAAMASMTPAKFDELLTGMANGQYGGNTSSSYSALGASVNSGSGALRRSKSVDYLNADLAKHYGMDARAAYSEALQNTAYQRAVADLKAAGLNPVLAAGQVSPAGSFAAGDTLAGGSGAGSSGAVSYGKSGKYAFSEDQYNLMGVAGSVIGGVLGYVYSPAPWKIMGASTASVLGKNLVQSLAQGASSLQNLK